jgi:hypothetical protein
VKSKISCSNYRDFISMRKLFLCLGSGILAASLNGVCLSATASVSQQSHLNSAHGFIISQADQSALVKENRELLITNGALARKIAAKLGATVPSATIPTTGSPLEQNQALILQNQGVFKAIAVKAGATVPALGSVTGADQAEKNHNLLLQNKSIMVAILKKLDIAPAAPTELTGTFVDKNNILLVGNGKALAKIAAKLGVS